MKKIAFTLLTALAFAGLSTSNAFVSTSNTEFNLQDTTKKDTTKTPTDTLKTSKPKQ